jgi:hypothetical protein
VDFLLPVSFESQGWSDERSQLLAGYVMRNVSERLETPVVREIRILELEREIQDIRRDAHRKRREARLRIYGSVRDLEAYLRRERRNEAVSDLSYDLDRGRIENRSRTYAPTDLRAGSRDLERDIERSLDRVEFERRGRILDRQIRTRSRMRPPSVGVRSRVRPGFLGQR